MALNPKQIEHYKSQIQWPCSISDSFKHELLTGASKKTHKSGNQFNIHNQQQYGLYYVLNGSLMMTAPLLKEDHELSKLYCKCDWFCYAPVMNFKFPFGMQGQFLTKVDFLKVPVPHLNYMLSKSDELYKLLFFIKSQRADTLLEKCLINQSGSLEEKVVYTVLDIYRSQYAGVTPQLIDLTITQKQIAQLIGVNRARVNTTINSIEAEGILSTRRGGLIINDLTALREKLSAIQLMQYSNIDHE